MRMTKARTMIITWLSTHRPFQRNEEIERKKIIEGRRKYQSVAGRQAGNLMSLYAFHLQSLHCSWCVESLTFACRVSGTRKSCSSKEFQGKGLC